MTSQNKLTPLPVVIDTPLGAAYGHTSFDKWWRASKYCQVALGQNRQIALDGWNAALTNAPIIALADAVAEALQNMGDFLAYGLAKADDAAPTDEDHRAVFEISARAREALDAYHKARGGRQ